MDEGDCLVGHVETLGDDVVAIFDALVSRVGILCLKWGDAIVKGVQNDANTPNVNLEVVAFSL